jgi:hypothetical protein
MKKVVALTALALSVALVSPAFAVEPDTGKATTTEGAETSDRTPEKTTTTPQAQVDTTESGETSDRSGKDGKTSDKMDTPESTSE